MGQRLAVDLSNWTTSTKVPGLTVPNGGALTPELVRDFREAGLDHAIIGTQWPDVAAHQLELCREGGMSLELYHWISWGRLGGQRDYVRNRVRQFSFYPIEMHNLDVEETPIGVSQDRMLEEIGQGERGVLDLGGRPGMYTGEWWWDRWLRGRTEFAHLPLWHAGYSGREGVYVGRAAAPMFEKFRPYGGWTRPRIWQFAGSVSLAQVQQIDGLEVTGRYANLDVNVRGDLAPIGEFGGEMIRFNAIAKSKDPAWVWEGQTIEGAGHMDARDDLNLPDGAVAIRLDVYLASGRLRVLDGDTKAYAGQVGWGEEAEADQGQIDVVLGQDGRIRFEGSQAVIKSLGVVGYWREGGITL